MKTGQAGINLIKQFEGCRLDAYKCPAGVWTIGYGHTSGVKEGQKITQAQAEAYLVADLARFETNVNKYNGKYSWTQSEFDALVSFAFNLGSIDQLTANGTRSRAVIAEKMLLYNKASGKVLEGLTRRRQAERDLFLSGSNINKETPVQNTESSTVYIVQKGDTLSKIAAKYGTTYQKLAEYNGITNPSVITVGQKIKIPGVGAQGSSGNPEKTYKVKGGDSLWTIAAKELGNGNRYKEIKSLNGLKNDTIYPGQVLKLPN